MPSPSLLRQQIFGKHLGTFLHAFQTKRGPKLPYCLSKARAKWGGGLLTRVWWRTAPPKNVRCFDCFCYGEYNEIYDDLSRIVRRRRIFFGFQLVIRLILYHWLKSEPLSSLARAQGGHLPPPLAEVKVGPFENKLWPGQGACPGGGELGRRYPLLASWGPSLNKNACMKGQ